MQKLDAQGLGDLPKETGRVGQVYKPCPFVSHLELTLLCFRENSLTCAQRKMLNDSLMWSVLSEAQLPLLFLPHSTLCFLKGRADEEGTGLKIHRCARIWSWQVRGPCSKAIALQEPAPLTKARTLEAG